MHPATRELRPATLLMMLLLLLLLPPASADPGLSTLVRLSEPDAVFLDRSAPYRWQPW